MRTPMTGAARGPRWVLGGTAEPAVPVLDEAVLAELAERLGSDKVSMFAAMFRTQAVGLIAAMDGAMAPRIVREAHSMASVAGMLGLAQLMEACRRVLVAAREGPTTVPALAPALKSATETALAALAARFPDSA